jgi:predicted secreted protein
MLCALSGVSYAGISPKDCDALSAYTAQVTDSLKSGKKLKLFKAHSDQLKAMAESIVRVAVKQLKARPEVTAAQMGEGFKQFCYNAAGDTDVMQALMQAYLEEKDL